MSKTNLNDYTAGMLKIIEEIERVTEQYKDWIKKLETSSND